VWETKQLATAAVQHDVLLRVSLCGQMPPVASFVDATAHLLIGEVAMQLVF